MIDARILRTLALPALVAITAISGPARAFAPPEHKELGDRGLAAAVEALK